MKRGSLNDDFYKLFIIVIKLSFVVAAWGINNAVDDIKFSIKALEAKVTKLEAAAIETDKEIRHRVTRLEGKHEAK